MNKILFAVLTFAILSLLTINARANSCSGYKVSNECIPAENILDGVLGAAVQCSAVCSSTSPAGVAITYGVTAGSVTVNGVGIINASGQIPAISATYFTSLSGAALTALTAANVSVGSLPVGVLAQGIVSKTLAQLASLVPTSVGQIYYVSDGTVDTLAISTQTVTANWQGNTESRASGGTNAH